MSGKARITVPSDPAFLSAVRNFTARMAKLYGLDRRSASAVKLAVDEACTNIIKYAYGGSAAKKITIKYTTTARGFQVTIEDDGAKCRTSQLKGRSLLDVRPGGLGVHLIKRAFDVCEIDSRKKNGNRLRLIRYHKKTGRDK